jgi:hypothetical protein
MGDTGRHDEAGDRTLRDDGVLDPLLISETDQRRSLHGEYLRPAEMIMVAPYATRLGDYHMHIRLVAETLRIERLEHAAPMVLMEDDRFDSDTPG